LHLFDKDVKMRCCQNFECSHHLVTPNKWPFKLGYIGKFEPTLPRFLFLANYCQIGTWKKLKTF
jgi:hypothetical protein